MPDQPGEARILAAGAIELDHLAHRGEAEGQVLPRDRQAFGGQPREPFFKVNNILAAARACIQGLGIAALPLLALAGGLANATVDALFLFGPDDFYRYRAIVPAAVEAEAGRPT